MSDSKIQKKVIWAIDPFEKETRPNSGVLKEFLGWMKASQYAVQPFYVLSVSAIDPSEIDDGTWLTRVVPSAEKTTAQYLSSLGVSGTLPPQVSVCTNESRSKAVQRLLSLAESEESPMIALSSHGRSGLRRLALGSFAENVLLQSEKPVLFLNHSKQETNSNIEPHIGKILFPTDLSRNSRAAFRLLLPQAKALGAELILFYAVALPSSAVSGSGSLGGIDAGIPNDYFEVQAAWATEELKEWATEARVRGVASRAIVKEEGVTNQIAAAVLSIAAQEKVQLIAMASLSGPFTSFVVGSVAREVFRTQLYPVWVCGPKVLFEKSEKSTGKLPGNSNDGLTFGPRGIL